MPERVWRFFFRDHRLLLRYVLVGAGSALIEFSLFSFLYQSALWPLLLANGVALTVAIVFNFLMHRNWTFRQTQDAGRQLRWYLAMQVVAVGLNNALVWAFVKELGWYPPLAKLIEIGIVFIWTFSFSRLVVFSNTEAYAHPIDSRSQGRKHAR